MARTCDMDERWPHSKGPFIWGIGNREKTNRMPPTMLQGCMQARPLGPWHKHRLLGCYCHRQSCLGTHSKVGLSQYEETQQLKVEEKRLCKKTVCQASRPTTAFTCSKCGMDCYSWIALHSHKNAAQWVQIYGLLRPTDAHDICMDMCVCMPAHVYVYKVIPM